jgi:hypothetical protein
VVKYLKWEILAGIDEVGECIVNKWTGLCKKVTYGASMELGIFWQW